MVPLKLTLSPGTNHHKFSGQKQHIYYLTVLEVRSLKMVLTELKLNVIMAVTFGGSGVNLLPWLFQLLEAACIPWLRAPFHFQRQK